MASSATARRSKRAGNSAFRSVIPKQKGLEQEPGWEIISKQIYETKVSVGLD